MDLSRRSLVLAGSAAAGALVLPRGTFATDRAASELPAQRNFVIRNASLLTMDPVFGDITQGDIHIRGGAIVAIGQRLEARGAQLIDGTGMIVMPGLIDTHFHVWQTLFRSFGGTTPDKFYFPSLHHFAAAMEPSDMYATALLAASEAVSAGVTTIHDWCHNIRTKAHAEQNLRGLQEVGIRARFSFGQWEDSSVDVTMRLPDLEAMHSEWDRYSNGGLIHLGMAWRGLYRKEWLKPEVWKTEYETARRLGIPITTHTGSLASSTGHVARHYQAGLLNDMVNIVHGTSATPEEVDMIKQSGASISSLPMTEMLGGWGMPPLAQFIKAGIRCGLGIDTAVLGGSTNFFKVMQFAMASCNVEALSEVALTPRGALTLGTIGAAQVLGIADRVGSLSVGKRADIIMIDTRTPGIAVHNDLAATIVGSATPASVDTVFVDGRLLKRKGKMLSVHTGEVLANARASRMAVNSRMKFP